MSAAIRVMQTSEATKDDMGAALFARDGQSRLRCSNDE
jgi:hypothetical protein